MPLTPTVLTLTCPGLSLGLISTGAAITRLDVADDLGRRNIVLGHEAAGSYRDVGGYLGAVIGRVGNRIDQGRFELDGAAYHVPPNDGPNALHGGPVGFDLREWTLEFATDEQATWALVSEDGDQGFPGELTVRVRYAVAPGLVSIDYVATTTAPTPVDLTNHSYLNLDGEASGDVLGHRLQVEADTYLPTRTDQIPTGELRPVEGTPFDLRDPTVLADALAGQDDQLAIKGGIDHHFAVRGDGMRRHATLVGASGRRLEVWSDRPGVQVYTGAHFDGSVVGTSGRAYGAAGGLALETQAPPDAINQDGFPSPVLRPGETFRSRTEWRLS